MEAMKSLIVACVLKSGGDFNPKHVEILERMVKKHLTTVPYEFVCLTDFAIQDVKCETIPLENNLEGWWSKIELFKVQGPLLYFDLDTIIVGSLNDIASTVPHIEFGIMRDFFRPNFMASGVMCWSGNQRRMFQEFHPRFIREMYRGDQEFVENKARNVSFLQDLFPGAFLSFKADNLHTYDIPEEASVVCFHGLPRPWNQEKIPYA